VLSRLIAMEARARLLASNTPFCLALHARLLIDGLKLPQGPINYFNQLIVTQRAILPEHEKR
jgi:hypothetical protein